jgi:NNP family nitrate/nitrite transporter-like MFS transporter
MKKRKRHIEYWEPEDDSYWHSKGKRIAHRNLWISIPSLLCGFAIWMYWSIVTVQMLNIGLPFTQPELFTLAAIGGLSGATLRIPSSFLIRIAGGRNTIFLTTLLLMIPAFGTGFALQNPTTPLWTYQLLALLSGIGGGNFASSMSNISFFFPKKKQGLALGLNAGLGNFGVTTMQILIPLVMTFGIFGGEPSILKSASGSLIGKIPAGTETWIHNAGYVWVAILVPLVIAAWFGMHNITASHVSPNLSSPLSAFAKIILMLLIGFIAAGLGFIAMKPVVAGGLGISKWVVLPSIILATLLLLRAVPAGEQYKQNLARQYKIFNNKHTWAMTVIYTMTFGSFIGYSAALALSIQVIFGFKHVLVDGVLTHTIANPNAPSALMYAWIGAFVGALIRPIGGWISDKLGGALVTQISSFVMILATLGVAYYMKLAYGSETPEEFFVPFLLLIVLLFLATGIGNGSTFRTIAVVFDKEQAGPVLGWTSAIAAYGAFIIPQIIGEQIKAATPEVALYGFAVFYAVCMGINWWFYLRKNAYVKNP